MTTLKAATNYGSEKTRSEWRDGWGLVLAATVGFSFYSIMSVASGVFMEPIGDQFSWSRTQVSAGLSIGALITAALSPFFGILIDRWGVRRIALPGLVLTSLAIASFGMASGSFIQWLALWTVFGLVSLSIKSTVWTTAVAGAFVASRGAAMGLALAGASVAQAVSPPLANWLISQLGWRGAFAALGLGWGLFAFGLCLMLLRDPRTSDRQAQTPIAGDVPAAGLTLAQAWRSSALWKLAISTLLMMTLGVGLTIHMFPILVESGMDRTSAAWLASLGGLASFAGKLVTGMLVDRFSPRFVGSLTLLAAGIACALLLNSVQTPVIFALAIILNSYSSGGKLQITGYLTARIAGLRNFGKIFGVIAAMVAAGGSLGPLLAGWLYDLYGSYDLFLMVGLAGAMVSALLIFTIPDGEVTLVHAPQ